FVGKGLHILDLEYAASGLDLVVVDDGSEVVEPMLVRTGRGFPHGALVDLAIAHKHHDPRLALLNAGCNRETNANRQAVTQGTGACFHPGRDHFGMTTEDRVEVAESIKLGQRKVPLVCKHGIES